MATTEKGPIGLLASAAAAVLWGFGGILAALAYAPGVVLAFYRLWLGAALLLAVLYSRGRRLSWSLLGATWLGGVLLAGDMAMFYCAVKSTSIVDVSVIGACQPALVMVVSRRLFDERLSRWDVTWILLAMTGVCLAAIAPGVGNRHALVGDALALGSMVSFSAYWMVSKRAREACGTLEYTSGVTLIAALAITVVVLALRQPLGRIEAGDWLWIVLMVTVPGSGHLVMNWAHRFVDASISSAVSCLSPLVAALAAIPLLGQDLSALQVVGVGLGLTAISVIAVGQRLVIESPVE